MCALCGVLPPAYNPPETTHAMLAWANPVFVREGMKHTGGCLESLAPNETRTGAASLH